MCLVKKFQSFSFFNKERADFGLKGVIFIFV
uniref:Uncharacterized protein n=1 Tax=Rhizophora mucronata TaxID=61149 RepID=A0A2P2PFY8_RHIMU